MRSDTFIEIIKGQAYGIVLGDSHNFFMDITNWNEILTTGIYQQIIDDWENLLSDTNLKERDYHEFLRKTPGIFLTISESYMVISKLKLGSDYETDFVVIEEGYSDGTKYEVIEIESPHTELFDKSGKPSAKLNSALQQIRDWKRYLMDNRYEMKKSFPSKSSAIANNSKLRFKIIIGRSPKNLEHQEKRRQLEEDTGIEIISFDRLTAMAKARRYLPEIAQIYSTELEGLPYEIKNQLANPLFECTSDSEWKKMNKKGGFHFYYFMMDEILKYRTYNTYFEKFKKVAKKC